MNGATHITKIRPPPFSYLITRNLDKRAWGHCPVHLPCGRVFYGSPDLPKGTCAVSPAGAYVFAAGLMIDVDRSTMDLDGIAQDLLAHLQNDRAVFWDALDTIAGRWIVVFKEAGASSPWIVGDATNMLKVNYTEDGTTCSSNIFLIKSTREERSLTFRPSYSLLRKLWKYGALGNYAPLEGIKILTPNHALNLGNGEVHRFFPRSIICSDRTMPAIAEEVIRLCEVQLSLLQETFTLLPSITGGIDSRLSLALLKMTPGLTYFTYVVHEIHRADAVVAMKLAHILGLNHYCLFHAKYSNKDIYSGPNSSPVMISRDDAFHEKVNAWDWYQHSSHALDSHRALVSHLKNRGDRRILHIRSNIYEIVRCFWGKRYGPCRNVANILYQSRRDWAEYADPIFDEFFAETQIAETAKWGYDLLDIFYWEHRCGTWVSEILQGSDFVFNTHCLLNCRKIIVPLLSLPWQERVNAAAFRHIIDTRLPSVSTVPINPPDPTPIFGIA